MILSVVLPNTELFISLKNPKFGSVSSPHFRVFVNIPFKPLWLNFKAVCIILSLIPRFKHSFAFTWCRTYVSLSLNVDIYFTQAVVCLGPIYVGHSKPTSRVWPSSESFAVVTPVLTSLTHSNSPFWRHRLSLSIQVTAIQVRKAAACLVGAIGFRAFAVGFDIHFTALRYATS
jgi:hypothetical protein